MWRAANDPVSRRRAPRYGVIPLTSSCGARKQERSRARPFFSAPSFEVRPFSPLRESRKAPLVSVVWPNTLAPRTSTLCHSAACEKKRERSVPTTNAERNSSSKRRATARFHRLEFVKTSVLAGRFCVKRCSNLVLASTARCARGRRALNPEGLCHKHRVALVTPRGVQKNVQSVSLKGSHCDELTVQRGREQYAHARKNLGQQTRHRGVHRHTRCSREVLRLRHEMKKGRAAADVRGMRRASERSLYNGASGGDSCIASIKQEEEEASLLLLHRPEAIKVIRTAAASRRSPSNSGTLSQLEAAALLHFGAPTTGQRPNRPPVAADAPGVEMPGGRPAPSFAPFKTTTKKKDIIGACFLNRERCASSCRSPRAHVRGRSASRHAPNGV